MGKADFDMQVRNLWWLISRAGGVLLALLSEPDEVPPGEAPACLHMSERPLIDLHLRYPCLQILLPHPYPKFFAFMLLAPGRVSTCAVSSMTTKAQVNEVTDFLEQIERSKVLAVDESSPGGVRPFIPTHELRKYLTETRLRKLLLYANRFPNDWEAIRDSYLAVFAILISIGRGAYISHFTRYDHLADSRLPFRTDNDWSMDCKSFFNQFVDAQWKFCAKRLENGRLNDTSIPDPMVIPFLKKSVLKEGPDSKVFKVELHAEYNYLTRDADGRSTTNTFVLKTCRTEQNRYYYNEVEAYKTLMSQAGQDDALRHVARFYGSWTHGDTHNILLEYVGGGTLTTFFENHKPPTTEEDILRFWSNFIEITKPIIRLHHLPDPNTHHSYIQGLHNDIKPDNILVSDRNGDSPFDVTYKLADLGLTGFVLANDADENVHMRDTHGTQMYSAPEHHRGEHDRFVQQSIRRANPSKDVWSLACVFSEAAVWSVFGPAGLEDYRRHRTDATDKMSSLRNTAYSGCFHDGEGVLEAVHLMHYTVECGRRTHIDNVVSHVLLTVEGMMTHESSRPSALKVYEDLRRALELAGAQKQIAVGPLSTPQSSLVHRWAQQKLPASGPDALGLRFSPTLSPPTSPSSHGYAEASANAPNVTLRPQPIVVEEDRSHPISTRFSSNVQSFHSEDRIEDQNHGRNGVPYSFPKSNIPSPTRSLSTRYEPSPQAPFKRPLSMGSVLYAEEAPTFDFATSAPNNTSQAQHVPAHRGNGASVQNIVPSPTRPKLPMASVDEVLKWINKKQSGSNAVLEGQDWLQRLHGRDQIFLIDDSKSMLPHWDEVKRVFKALAYLVKELDQDGIELCFTNNCSQDGREKHRKKLLKTLSRVRPGGQCNMGFALEKIFPRYYPNRTGSRIPWNLLRPEKPGVNIYILTDGIWQQGDDPLGGVQEHIKSLVDKLVDAGKFGHVGIQFIRFGNDEAGKKRLDDLDNNLQGMYKVRKDIVDTEPADGNVFKMIFGSVDRLWDEQNVRERI